MTTPISQRTPNKESIHLPTSHLPDGDNYVRVYKVQAVDYSVNEDIEANSARQAMHTILKKLGFKPLPKISKERGVDVAKCQVSSDHPSGVMTIRAWQVALLYTQAQS